MCTDFGLGAPYAVLDIYAFNLGLWWGLEGCAFVRCCSLDLGLFIVRLAGSTAKGLKVQRPSGSKYPNIEFSGPKLLTLNPVNPKP